MKFFSKNLSSATKSYENLVFMGTSRGDRCFEKAFIYHPFGASVTIFALFRVLFAFFSSLCEYGEKKI